jgi:hypothetical protein
MSMEQENIYRGFYIKEEIYKSEIDNFYKSIIVDDDEIYVLKNFWKRHCPKINLPYMSLDNSEELLFSIIDNEELWNKFNKVIHRDIKLNEDILISPDIQEQILKGETYLTIKMFNQIDIGIDLKPLFEFSYWLKLINNLFISVIRELLDQIKMINTKIERAILIKRLISVNMRCIPLIRNKYAYNDLSYYNTQIEKMLSFFDEGLEFALYSFGMMFPNLVDENIHPIINTTSVLYNHPELKITVNDPTFGEAKKQFFQFY